ncbi:MAG: YetF domain-containing protein [Alteraurantiacibacter sp.]
MFFENDTLDAVLRGAILAMVALTWVVVQIRILGLRSLSKMTTYDFVMTIALGSLVATAATVSDWLAFGQAMAAMVGLFVLQFVAARIRKGSDTAESVMQNEPVLLMRDGKINHQALTETRVAESDLRAKLREANVLDYSKVRAVVLETTGDVSVLHGDTLDEGLLDGVDCHE